jgi:hypothetical protein
MRRLLRESMHAGIIVPDGAEGAFGAGPPAFVPSSSVKLNVHDDAKGAFGARPLACIPNSSPSQARFKESTPMSRSYDLFYEGS